MQASSVEPAADARRRRWMSVGLAVAGLAVDAAILALALFRPEGGFRPAVLWLALVAPLAAGVMAPRGGLAVGVAALASLVVVAAAWLAAPAPQPCHPGNVDQCFDERALTTAALAFAAGLAVAAMAVGVGLRWAWRSSRKLVA